jgi:hypothetical protein
MRRAAVCLLAAFPLFAQQTGAIHGTVKDAATGQPLSDFSITASSAIMGAPKVPPNASVITFRSVRTNTQITVDADSGKTISEIEIPRDQAAYTGSDGKYTLTNVAAGKVTITARNLRRDTVTKEVVTLNPGDDVAVDLLVPPNAMASGRVLDPDKKPVPGVQVWAVQSSSADGVTHYSLFGPRLTDDNGAFLFDWGLAAGKTFYLLAQRPRPAQIEPGKPIEAPTYYGNATALDAATPIVLERGENLASLDIQFRKSAQYCVEGTLAVSGKPARNPFEIRELALAETSLGRAGGASGDDGKYRVCGLTPGQYRIIGNGPNGVAGMEDFTVGNSDVAHVDLMLDAVPLHLTVVWDGVPVTTPPLPSALGARLAEMGMTNRAPLQPSVQVSLNGLGGLESHTAAVNPPYDGLFDSHLAVGDYRATVRPPACCYIKEVDYGGVRLSGPLHLGAGSSGTLRVLIGTDGATLRCQARDDDGKPVETAAIVLIPDAPDSEPQLHWNVIAPGKYKVMAVNRNLTLPEDLEKVHAMLGHAQSVELAPKAKLELSLKALSID